MADKWLAIKKLRKKERTKKSTGENKRQSKVNLTSTLFEIVAMNNTFDYRFQWLKLAPPTDKSKFVIILIVFYAFVFLIFIQIAR